MEHDIQKASMWKRISAGMFDWILTGILAVGFAFLLSAILGYDGYVQSMEDAYARYEAQFGISFSISQAEFDALSDDVKVLYEQANEALNADEQAVYAYNMMTNLMLVITTVGILIGIVIMELVVPLCFKNGQTLGKKIFGLCLIRNDGVKMNNMQLFTRTILGKFTLETMVPVYIILMLFFSSIGLTGTVVLGLILLLQLGLMVFTKTNSMIHDLLAGTVVVDYASQRIFRTTDDLIAYQKQIAAERAARQNY